MVGHRAYEDGSRPLTNSNPVDRFVGARPRPTASDGIVVANHQSSYFKKSCEGLKIYLICN